MLCLPKFGDREALHQQPFAFRDTARGVNVMAAQRKQFLFVQQAALAKV